jgi:hypothetical protein
VAIAISGFGILLCIFLAARPEPGAVRGAVRTARRGRPPASPGWGPERASLRALLGFPRPTTSAPRAWSWTRSIGVAVGWGLAVAVVSRPAIGAAAGMGAILALRRPSGRTVCRLAAVVMFVALPVYAATQQAHHHYYPSIDWPADLSSANDMAWLALAFIGSDLVGGAVYARAGMREEK